MKNIITVVNQKGGVGKSTIAMNLAAALSHSKHSVFIVDADPQGTISRWAKVRARQVASSNDHPLKIEVTNEPWLPEHIMKLPEANQHDFVIVDCGPANNKVVKAALAVSSLALIPISPSPLDMDSARSTIALIGEGTARGAIKIDAALVVSKKIVGTTLAQEARQAAEALGLPVLKTEVSQRIALCESAITGQTVLEYAPGSPAAEEFISLGKEILKWLKRG